MRYDYHCSNGVAIELPAGYRIFAYWDLEELSRSTNFSGGDDIQLLINLFPNDDTLSYSGPYVRFAVFY